MFKVTLVKGETYEVMDHVFVAGIEKEVSQEVYTYLQGNTQFELREEKKGSSTKKESAVPKKGNEE